ncbi:exopolyphosphatase [Aureimonas ureilytica]|uniref:Exopolyphosphatase n=1 Tax=Aureimonas ureilytica TaxID=401562 RepID=A0A175R9D0_9HYPH|nr:Ppx/GppA phosphatase family protein [Aureimonas ureilytica]KTQ95998.1 exopolyphosphatase [Aureimonas ureilytica]
MSQGGERAGAETGEARASARPQRGAPNAGSHPSPSAAGKPSKRQKRRRRKTNAPAAPPPGGSALRELPPALGAKVAEAERVLRERKGPPGARPGQGKNRRRRKGRAGFPAAAQPAGAASGRPSPAPVPPAAPHAPSRSTATHGAPRVPAYAALDLGTNNCRLLIAVPTRPGQFRVIDAFSRIVRLGEGLGRTGSLAGTAMDRAVAALEICSHKLSAREIRGARLIATEACRSAANGREFITRVQRETGLRLEIVSRETEARLAVSGCGSLIDRSARGAVLFDIGGGSTEIALLDLRRGTNRRLANNIVAWTSLPVGVVSLAEKHGGRNVTPELFEHMVREVEAMIHAFPGRNRLADLVGRDGFHLLGTSGTVTTLAGIQLGLERYDRRQVDGLWLNDRDVDGLVGKLLGWSFEERVANPCIGSDRADLVLAGCAILQAIRRVWPAKVLRVADRGLREGLLTEMMVADGVWRRPASHLAGTGQAGSDA